jgi:hypothetical protein
VKVGLVATKVTMDHQFDPTEATFKADFNFLCFYKISNIDFAMPSMIEFWILVFLCVVIFHAL